MLSFCLPSFPQPLVPGNHLSDFFTSQFICISRISYKCNHSVDNSFFYIWCFTQNDIKINLLSHTPAVYSFLLLKSVVAFIYGYATFCLPTLDGHFPVAKSVPFLKKVFPGHISQCLASSGLSRSIWPLPFSKDSSEISRGGVLELLSKPT